MCNALPPLLPVTEVRVSLFQVLRPPSKGKKVKGKKVKSRDLQCAMLSSPLLLQEISAESVLCYRKESAWEAFVDGLDVAEQFITSQSSLGTGNEIWWQLFPLVP